MKGAPRASVATVGCRLNQCEGTEIARGLRAAGYEPVPFPGPAEVYVIHTCCVTAHAEADCRSAVGRARRASPGARIIASGCFAQLFPGKLAALAGVTDVAGTGGWSEIEGLIPPADEGAGRAGEPAADPDATECVGEGGRSRALVKVQDGCSRLCSFCVVPGARGPGRSLPADLVIEKVRGLAHQGFGEVVLTGANLGTWGRDLDPPRTLADLLAAIREDPGAARASEAAPRIRLSSIDPRDLSDALVGRIAGSSRICPHLHVSLQSADDGLLSAMGRGVGSARIRERLEIALDRIEDLALGLDLIAGFPGETDDAFARTEALVEALGLAYLHVFPFSPRPGTRAASLAGTVPVQVVRDRVRRLRDLSREKREAFHAARLGRALEVVVERGRNGGEAGREGWIRSISREYVPVFLPPGRHESGREIEVVATGSRGGGRGLVGRPAHG